MTNTRVPSGESSDRPPGDRAARRGRPPATSRRELELIALQLFTERGFDNTTVDDIADAAHVNRRTFFRYFDSKSAVLWSDFDTEVESLRAAFAALGGEVSVMDGIRQVVVGVNQYRAEDVPELRARMNLIGSIPALQASAAPHYDAWERAVSDYAAARTGLPADSLYPLAIGRTTLAACRAAYDLWVTRADNDLTLYLDEALQALADGFARPPAPQT
ncbi:TetR family transcriptional regulator [Jatrophihabitans sp. GAS493]|uniref:mycofactocin system transcriptional regulator n=1 Tax=Jatrophihabitans sp. GAS493 TaxID=1907575 RepID=UPI000BB90BEF|nr:mycofactocin system transcriptional regulator [Jatrophihabitans sp. GAS493]SOD72171.1 TetR family transcriptional regulator [Jatrophihabitans sp. GAS493]